MHYIDFRNRIIYIVKFTVLYRFFFFLNIKNLFLTVSRSEHPLPLLLSAQISLNGRFSLQDWKLANSTIKCISHFFHFIVFFAFQLGIVACSDFWKNTDQGYSQGLNHQLQFWFEAVFPLRVKLRHAPLSFLLSFTNCTVNHLQVLHAYSFCSGKEESCQSAERFVLDTRAREA